MICDNDLQRATLALKVATNLISIAPAAQNHATVLKAAVTATASELI